MATSTLQPLAITLRRVVTFPRAPLIALAVISLLSLGARAYKLGEPCSVPCRTANDHTLIFDEAYYVNAARVIAGIHPPAGAHYAKSPLGSDPNAEHPQGAKLIIAGAIELFGDGPFAWRIGSLIFGTLAILAMYYLVRSAGGDPWPAVGADRAKQLSEQDLGVPAGQRRVTALVVVAGVVEEVDARPQRMVEHALGVGTVHALEGPPGAQGDPRHAQ